MKILSYIVQLLRNKYILSAVAFVIWMLFFDRNDVFTQFERRRELNTLQEGKKYFTTQISQERRSLEELKSNPAAIEKYAREKYGMKRDNEDVFIIQTQENK